MRWLCQIAYDGSFYSGFQIQPQRVTIQGELEQALATIHGIPVAVVGAGRTDAGVHAYAQYIHFDSDLGLDASSWLRALNANLPLTIRIVNVHHVHDKFHARYNAHHKQYQYKVSTGAVDPLRIRYVHYLPYHLDVAAIQEATSCFVGTHNFHNFTANHTPSMDYVRTVTRCECYVEGSEWTFIVEGNGFLHHMVRMMVGTLLEIGKGRHTKEDLLRRLSSPENDTTPFNAPAMGLYLTRVDYQGVMTND